MSLIKHGGVPRSRFPALAASLAAGWLAVVAGSGRAEAGADAEVFAQAVQCRGLVNDYLPTNPDDAKQQSFGFKRIASASRGFAGAGCRGEQTRATALGSATFVVLAGAVDVDNGGLAANEIQPFASVAVNLTRLFVLRNPHPHTLPFTVIIDFRGSVKGVSARCQHPVAVRPCFDAFFGGDMGGAVDRFGKLVDVTHVDLPRNDSLYLDTLLPPRDALRLLFAYGVVAEVHDKGTVVFGQNLIGASVSSGSVTAAVGGTLPGVALYFVLPDGVELLGDEDSGVPGSEFADAVLRPGQPIPRPGGSLAISPGSGTLAATQGFDLALIAQTAGQTVAGLTATLDGSDISAPLSACFAAHPGALALATPGLVLRCPGLAGGLLGPGSHTLAVSLALGGGGTLTDSVTWEVVANAE